MKHYALILAVILAIGQTGCKKDNEGPVKSGFIEYEGKTLDLTKGFFVDYGPTNQNNHDFDIFMYSGMHIYDPDSTTGSGPVIGFNIVSPTSTIASGIYHYSEVWDVSKTFWTGLFTMKWNENDPGNQDWIYIEDGTIEITSSGNTFEVAFNCKTSEGKDVSGQYKGIPEFFIGY